MIPKINISLKQLLESMLRFGLDSSLVESTQEAARMLRAKWKADGLSSDWECPACGMLIPDFDSCPFCGSEFKHAEPSSVFLALCERKPKGIPAMLYQGARRGRVPEGEQRSKGTTILAALIRALGIPEKFVKVRGRSVGLWCNWGCFTRCYIGVTSVRLYLPIRKQYYEKDYSILVNLMSEHKYQKSRIFLDHESKIPEVLEILAQTIALKKELKEAKLKEKRANEEAGGGIKGKGRGRRGKRNRAGGGGSRGRSG